MKGNENALHSLYKEKWGISEMARTKYKNLVLIGNGFDRWQDLPTSYEDFRKYYIANVERVMCNLGFEKYDVIDAENKKKTFSAVELIYGDPFNPAKLPDEFFWNFETSLDKLDDQQLNVFFGRSNDGITKMRQLVVEAQKILRTVFCNWISEIEIPQTEPGIKFPEDCFFINFNYTDTLERRFGIAAKDIYYIHGKADRPESIVVGHSSHPEMAFSELVEHNIMQAMPDGSPRFAGLYAVEDALYQTDKHVEDNINLLCRELFRRGIHIEDFEKIYVLGHSFGEPDYEYFNYLDKVTRCGCDYDSLSATERLDMELLALLMCPNENIAEAVLIKWIQLNMEYASHHRERVFPELPSLYPELDAMDEKNGIRYCEEEAARAVKQRFLFEQADRTHKLLEELAKAMGLDRVPEGCHSVLGFADYIDMGHEQRRKNAVWHISYFSPSDKKRIEGVMKRLGQKRFKLYQGIEATLREVKKG